MSFRRRYLNKNLDQHKSKIKGKVLDVGGQKRPYDGVIVSRRIEGVEAWLFLNPDENTEPDFCCTADDIPIPDNYFDTLIMTEVLEYLVNPRQVFDELYRVSKPGCMMLLSTPFLVPIHADYPEDHVRYTPVMIRQLVSQSGFQIHTIDPMGSVGAVLSDILRISFTYSANSKTRYVILRKLLNRARPFFQFLDNRFDQQKHFITTGYFVICEK